MVWWVMFERMRRAANKLNLFYKIFYGTLAILFLVLALSSAASYLYSQRLLEEKISEKSIGLVKNINLSIQDNIVQVDSLIQLTFADQDVLSALSSNTDGSLLEMYNNQLKMQKFFQQFIYLRHDLSSIYIYLSKTKTFSYYRDGSLKLDYDPTGEAWFKATEASQGKTVITPPHLPFQLDRSGPVISFSRQLTNYAGEKEGVILMDFAADTLNTIINRANLDPSSLVLFTDRDGTIIYRSFAGEERAIDERYRSKITLQDTGQFTADLFGSRYLVTFHTSQLTGWKLLTLTPYKLIAMEGNRLLVINALIAFGGLLLAILLAYYFSKVVTTPIRKLNKGMTTVKRGDFDIQLEVPANDEVGQLVQNFNSMTATIKKLIVEKYEETLERKEAEYKYLQSQINPHFINNTLQTISSIAAVYGIKEITQMSKQLGDMLRYGINMSQKMVPFFKEVQNVINYLEIQKVRFKDFLEYSIDVEEEVNMVGVTKLILQPIVENAIIHGIQGKGKEGMIWIRAFVRDDRIVVEVEDNGLGIAPDQLRILKEELDMQNGHTGGDKERIGLKNIHQRMKYVYGPDYGLQVESEHGVRTKVTFHIPRKMGT
ncbi:sensor histidine kinase [Paenibacillus sp. sptzw28]|uniref:cache domain-containing sensor histidine kinase n=1 Tax=Paenibacillus sp. sptzw28 TaxID=715179 RepID=UPI001C6ED7DD|nr:sensor histidine kinase [Paenibacillus sp. sptzw28]QYR20589.1 sensor histidine kinase [Paenibacillus sp. sptzw28]